ncbi:glycosyltransferase [Arthrobacter sp. NPDC080073]|uniref:glycosyltransferase family 2 protein n=1 Tax=Arthrobacter sp. NPDC080073 TaxID=3155919 RepID=UPI003420960B
MNIAVLCAVYNRKETTIRGLTSLLKATAETPYSLEIFLLDDGSSDGTAEKVGELFPEVTIISGSGDLYWNRGMCKAFEASLASRDYDAYLLFNDDVEVLPQSTQTFFSEYERLNAIRPTIVVGSTISRSSGETTYGAFVETSRIKALAFASVGAVDETTVCDTFNGNFVLVPGAFFRKVGGLDPKYHHGLGDIDLGLVARRHGVNSVLASDPIGYCEKGQQQDSRLADADLFQRWRLIFGAPNGLGPYSHFVWKHRSRVLFPIYVGLNVVKKLTKLAGIK